MQQRFWALHIGDRVAQAMLEEGHTLAAMTMKPSVHEFFVRERRDQYEQIISYDAIEENPHQFVEGVDISLKEVCDGLGVPTVWELVQSFRNHVKSYREKYYYSFKQNVSDEEIVIFVKAMYRVCRDLFDSFRPDLIVGANYASGINIMLNLIGMRRGVPMLGLSDTKIRGHYMLALDYLGNAGPVMSRTKELIAGYARSPNEGKAREYIAEFRKGFTLPEGFERIQKAKERGPTVREIGRFYYQLLRLALRGAPPVGHLGVTIDNRSVWYVLRDHWTHKRNLKKQHDFARYTPLASVKEFAYFPLQCQPEESIDVHGVRFNNQIETARQVAMSLPGDMCLVVKDHPAMDGMRSLSQLERLARTPNIKLVDSRVPGKDVLQRTQIVITPVGTSIAEAAFLRIPVIQLGRGFHTQLLPNVTCHTDMSTLPQVVIQALHHDFDNDEYERRLMCFVAGVFDRGFRFDYDLGWAAGDRDEAKKLVDAYLRDIADLLAASPGSVGARAAKAEGVRELGPRGSGLRVGEADAGASP